MNVSALRKLISFHKTQEADGFYICGATGEGLILSMETRKRLFEASIEEIGKDKIKIIHISDMNFNNTKYLAKYAEACGTDAISAIPPLYFSYDADDIYNTYNIMLPLYKEIYTCYNKSDMKHALEIQKKADNIISAVINYKLIPAIKVILEDMGFEVGNAISSVF